MSYLRTKIVQSRWTLAAVLMFGAIACSSESPTAPNNGGGNGGGGGTPPQGASVNVTVSNTSPVVSSTSTITATVTNNGAPVPDGTAVEFSTTRGTFTDTATSTTIRTTTNGVATATLTSSEAGTARVTVRVANVSRQVDVEFRVEDPGNGGGGLTVTGVEPAMSRPSGGEVVSIRGTGFEAPVRVLFGTREATIVSVSATEIRAVVPSIQLGAAEQSREVNITVINRAGTEGERSVTSPVPFRYQVEVLTPVVYTISPSTGPNEGNTRITIMGEGFQSPLKVFFIDSEGNSTEVEVLQVTYNQIIALTPPALGMGTGMANSQVTVRVLNVSSNTEGTLASAFRYGPGMAITAVSPTEGPYTGGTQVTIHGWGFDDPVAVSIGGVAAQPIRVSGTEIVVRTSGVQPTGCADLANQPIVVVNVEDGTTAANAPTFTYRVPQASIVGVFPSEPIAGSDVAVTVAGAGNPTQVRIKIGDRTILPSGATQNPDGTTTFTVTVPFNTALDEEACPAGGSRQVPTTFDLTFLNTGTSCEDVLPGGITVMPPDEPELFLTDPDPASLEAVVGSSATSRFVVINTGNDLLDVQSVTSSNPQFAVTNVTADLGPCGSAPATITFTPAAAETQSTTITVTTNDGVRTLEISGTGTAPAP